MNKDQLMNEINMLKKEIDSLKSNNEYLLNQQVEFKKIAEDAGSEVAKFKHQCIRYEEEINRLKTRIGEK